ncbi:WD40 repeat domain-containing protein [Actinosynnema sp. NPDC020468]|uniref:FG-GAP repeat domain-containing protein n=1 Tax=Actinosynnema sp. NPDC020468 TaxID=3154488 RepID=UPI0033F7DEE5
MTLIAAVATLFGSASPAMAAPPTPVFGPQIEGYAPYQGQTTCDPTPKPGVVDFRDLLKATYGRNDLGISRACSTGGTSEHKEGRALDYPFDATDAGQAAQATDVLNWLLATDQYGNTHALVRRLGIMYVIWNRRIWQADRAASGWQPYTGADPHTNHIHFSFGWAGARKETTWWTGARAPGSSLSGDSRAEIVNVEADGTVRAWRNVLGFDTLPWGGDSKIIATGFDPTRLHFPDLDGDGKSDIATVEGDGTVRAWHNVLGFETTPWGGDSKVIGTGFDPARLRFADLDGDRKSDIVAVEGDGTVRAWRNVLGFETMPWGGDSKIIATGFDPTRLRFADLDGDRKADITAVEADGTIRAWRNVLGFDTLPWGGDSKIIATGFDPTRLRFADFDGDGKSDIVAVEPDGTVRAWHNVLGFETTPWGGDSKIVGTGFTDPARLHFA